MEGESQESNNASEAKPADVFRPSSMGVKVKFLSTKEKLLSFTSVL